MERKRIMEITLSDGSKWEIPMEHIIQHRDAHYGSSGDDAEYVEWVLNSMDWGDLREVAVKARDKNTTISKAAVLAA